VKIGQVASGIAATIAVGVGVFALMAARQSAIAFMNTARVNAASTCASSAFILEEAANAFYDAYVQRASASVIDNKYQGFMEKWRSFHAAFRICFWHSDNINPSLPEEIRDTVKKDHDSIVQGINNPVAKAGIPHINHQNSRSEIDKRVQVVNRWTESIFRGK
jgi:hypothetical protein